MMAVSNPDIVIPDSPKQNVSITFKRKPNIDTTDFKGARPKVKEDLREFVKMTVYDPDEPASCGTFCRNVAKFTAKCLNNGRKGCVYFGFNNGDQTEGIYVPETDPAYIKQVLNANMRTILDAAFSLCSSRQCDIVMETISDPIVINIDPGRPNHFLIHVNINPPVDKLYFGEKFRVCLPKTEISYQSAAVIFDEENIVINPAASGYRRLLENEVLKLSDIPEAEVELAGTEVLGKKQTYAFQRDEPRPSTSRDTSQSTPFSLQREPAHASSGSTSAGIGSSSTVTPVSSTLASGSPNRTISQNKTVTIASVELPRQQQASLSPAAIQEEDEEAITEPPETEAEMTEYTVGESEVEDVHTDNMSEHIDDDNRETRDELETDNESNTEETEHTEGGTDTEANEGEITTPSGSMLSPAEGIASDVIEECPLEGGEREARGAQGGKGKTDRSKKGMLRMLSFGDKNLRKSFSKIKLPKMKRSNSANK